MDMGERGAIVVSGGGRPAALSPASPPWESLAGVRFIEDVLKGESHFQRDSDGLGLARVAVTGRSAFSVDQEVVLRQAMVDRGWEVPQFVARRPAGLDGGELGVPLPRHSAVDALGGAPGEAGHRTVWHVSQCGVEPLDPPVWLADDVAVLKTVGAVIRGAGVRVAEVEPVPGVTAIRAVPGDSAAPDVVGVSAFPRQGDVGVWASSVLRAVVGALAASLDVNRDVQVWAFERFLVRSLGFGFAADVGRDVLERAYWSVAESLARQWEVTLVDGEGDRGRFERVTRTLVLGEGFGRGERGPARSVAAMFEVARVSGSKVLEEAADRGDMVVLLRSAGVGGPVSRPAEFDSVRWHGRSRLVGGMAAKRVAERVGIRYAAPADPHESLIAAEEVVRREGWRSLAIEAGNLAAWVVEGARGRLVAPLALS